MSGITLIAAPNDSLVSLWTLDESANDSATAGNSSDNGTFVGAPSYTPGIFGQAAALDGTNYISIPNSSDVDGSSGSITVSTWARLNVPGEFNTSWQTIAAKGQGTQWRLSRNSSSNGVAWAGGTNSEIRSGDISDGEWHHVVGVTIGDEETRLYLDGALIAVGDNPTINPGNGDLWIGNNPGVVTRFWVGAIDDVGIFNEALTPDQISAIHSLGTDDRFNYSLTQLNELFQIHTCEQETAVTIGDYQWKFLAQAPNDNRTFVRLSPDGSGVVASIGPAITSFSADHPVIPAGLPITLTWAVDPSATNLSIEPDIGDVGSLTDAAGNGSITLNPGPSVTTNYILSAVSAIGTNENSISVEVTDDPIIESFTTTAGIVQSGESITLQWTTLNATDITLNGNTVAASGSQSFTINQSMTFTLEASNGEGRETFTRTINLGNPGDPFLNEFLTNNNNGFRDLNDPEDSGDYDWIEISNPGNTPIEINGQYYLTDDAEDLTKWQIPNQTIGVNDYLVFFASNEDPAPSNRHTNFALSNNGEYLALVKSEGGTTTILTEFNEYPRQFLNTSFAATSDYSAFEYHPTPTPAAPNTGEGFIDYVRDIKFSIDRGIYETPQSIDITSKTSGFDIIYTTDGSEPSADNGTFLAAGTPFTASTTTTLRAIGIKRNCLPTSVNTQTYIFLDEVLDQPRRPFGWPVADINTQVFDYEMRSASRIDTTDENLKNALQTIPSISIVTDRQNLINENTGIYVNPRGKGRDWERESSLEFIYPPGYVSPDGIQEDIQINMGLRIRGGASRNPTNPKHAFRFIFRREYGDSKFEYPLFGNEGVDEFNILDLRTPQNYSWSFKTPGSSINTTGDFGRKNTFLREVSARDTQRDMGVPYTRSRYYHLYLNGLYWGLFMTQERVEENYGASYLPGGDEDDFDVLKSAGGSEGYVTEASDGNNVDWMITYDLTADVFTADPDDNSFYYQLQGLDSNGLRDPNLPVYLDVDNLIKYMLLVFHNGSFDSPLSTFIDVSNNWFAIRNRERDDLGWQFFAHDMEHSLGSWTSSFNDNERDDRTGPFWLTGWPGRKGDFSRTNPQYMHQHLLTNNEYRLRFSDIVQASFFNDGVFVEENYLERIAKRKNLVAQVIDAEAARWGDTQTRDSLARNEWEIAVESMESYFDGRIDKVLEQLHGDGLFPSSSENNAPILSQHGGGILPGFTLTLTNPNQDANNNGDPDGTIFYTLDGTDPRAPGGENVGINGESPITINGPVTVKARTRISASNWSPLSEAIFVTGDTPAPGELVISEINYHPADPTNAETAAGAALTPPENFDDEDFEFIEIQNVSAKSLDLSEVILGSTNINHAFIDEENDLTNLVLEPGNRIVIPRKTTAFEIRYPNSNFLSDYAGELSNNTDQVRLTLQDGTVLFSTTYRDDDGWPETADGDGRSLVLVDATLPNSPDGWRISITDNGNPAESDSENFVAAANGDDNGNGIENILEAVLRDASGNYVTPIPGTMKDGGQTYFTITLERYLPLDNIKVEIQESQNAENWSTSALILESSEALDGGIIREIYRSVEPTTTQQRDFVRVRASLR